MFLLGCAVVIPSLRRLTWLPQLDFQHQTYFFLSWENRILAFLNFRFKIFLKAFCKIVIYCAFNYSYCMSYFEYKYVLHRRILFCLYTVGKWSISSLYIASCSCTNWYSDKFLLLHLKDSNGNLELAVAFLTAKNSNIPQQEETTYYQTALPGNERYISVGSQADTSKCIFYV